MITRWIIHQRDSSGPSQVCDPIRGLDRKRSDDWVSFLITIGHRNRLRERFLKAYTDGMHDYEIWELLLTFLIPRRDVKPIAKNLIARFGSLSGVLDATPGELQTVEDVGPASYTHIKLVKKICSLYLAGRMEKRNLLTSPDRVVNFARMKPAGFPHESVQGDFSQHAKRNDWP